LNFLHRFPKNPPTSEFMTIRLVGQRCFLADGRYRDGRTERDTKRKTGIVKIITTFRSFVNAPDVGIQFLLQLALS